MTDERRLELEEQLEGPPLPIELSHLWMTFMRISNRRNNTGLGVSRLTWPDLDAFTRMTRTSLSTFEVEVIEAIDDQFVFVHNSGDGSGN